MVDPTGLITLSLAFSAPGSSVTDMTPIRTSPHRTMAPMRKVCLFPISSPSPDRGDVACGSGLHSRFHGDVEEWGEVPTGRGGAVQARRGQVRERPRWRVAVMSLLATGALMMSGCSLLGEEEPPTPAPTTEQIGRASCRERV